MRPTERGNSPLRETHDRQVVGVEKCRHRDTHPRGSEAERSGRRGFQPLLTPTLLDVYQHRGRDDVKVPGDIDVRGSLLLESTPLHWGRTAEREERESFARSTLLRQPGRPIDNGEGQAAFAGLDPCLSPALEAAFEARVHRRWLADLVTTTTRLGISSIALPAIGCGLGGLSWTEVKPLIEAAFDQQPAVRVVLFGPR